MSTDEQPPQEQVWDNLDKMPEISTVAGEEVKKLVQEHVWDTFKEVSEDEILKEHAQKEVDRFKKVPETAQIAVEEVKKEVQEKVWDNFDKIKNLL